MIIESWAEHHEHGIDSSLPVLLHPSTEGLTYHHMYFLSSDHYGWIQPVPELINKWIPGSLRNWLVTIETQGNQIHLLNPSTSDMKWIPLPSLSSFPCTEVNEGGPEKYWFVRRVVLSSHRETCRALALVGDKRTLCYCKIGDERWEKFYPSLRNILDIVTYNGLLYVVTNNGSLFAIDFNAEKKVTMVVSKLDMSKGIKLKLKSLGNVKFWNHPGHFLLGTKVDGPPTASTFYLVESLGELLLVVRISGYDLETKYFRVYKLAETESSYRGRYVTEDGEVHHEEEVKHIWVPIEDLNGQMLFVGRNSSLSFSSELHPAGKGDCIYFTDDNDRADVAKLEGEITFESDIGVYDMVEEEIQYFRGLKDSSSRSHSIWLTI
ncbi:hypothetical protein LUZ60_004310 [Juncus effusus]|nr:hypothetical protein LUZ60_004310 [Juncus effusus]